MSPSTLRGLAPGRLILVLLALVAGASLYLAPGARAETTIVVHSTADESGEEECPGADCTLREAIELAEEESGDVKIELAVEGTIELEDGELEIDTGEPDEIWIAGPGAEKLTIDAAGESRVFSIEEIETAKLSGVTITGGSTGEFHHGGAGIYADQVEKLILEDARVSGNTALNDGGGIEFEGGALELERTEVSENETETGQGGGIYGTGELGIGADESQIDANRAEESGGGIATQGNLVMRTTTVADNLTGEDGGGIYGKFEPGRRMLIEESKVEDNIAQAGGGVYLEGGEFEALFDEFSSNGARFGGAIWLEAQGLIAMSAIVHNQGPGASPQGGAGLYVAEGETVGLADSTVADNEGGGVFAEASGTTIENSTIAANTAQSVAGAGIHGDIKLASTIVAGNTAGPANENEDDCSGSVVSEGHNLIGEGVNGEGGCAWGGGEGDQFKADPELAPLGDYGGLTPTMPPQSRESPAINHGSNPHAIDQRGLRRPIPESPSFTDVGAVEVQAPVETSAPSIAPTAGLLVGQELSCLRGAWNTDTVTNPAYSYVWKAGHETVGAAEKLTLTNADAGKPIGCEVTVNDGATTASATSQNEVELEPALPSLAPTSLEFGAWRLDHGGTTAKPLTLTNDGSADLELSSVTSSDPTEFAVTADTCSGEALAPAASCQIFVAFDPAVEGDRSATLTIFTDAGELHATLGGRGTLGDFDADPAAIPFGDQVVGTTSGWQPVKIGNGGTGAFAIGTPTIEGSGAAAYELRGSGCEGKALAPGKGCTIKVRFAPTATGATSATLAVPGERPGSVALGGTGVEPAFAAAPASLDFGHLLVGESTSLSVTISNPGTAPAAISALTLEGSGGGQFEVVGSADQCTGTTLQPGEECTAEVAFTPTATGVASATLAVAGDAPGTVALSGTGVEPSFAISPTTHGFGAVQTGSRSAEAAFVVTDEGTGAMTIGTVAIEGAGEGEGAFHLGATDTCSNATLAPGDHCTVDVYFQPSLTGAAAATLAVPGTASGSASLQGEGTAQPASPNSGNASQPGVTSTTVINGGPTVTPPSAHLKVPASGVRVDAAGTARFGLACSTGRSACAVTLEFLSGSGPKARKLARWRGRVAAGATRSIKLRLPRAARETLARKGKLRVTALIATAGGAKTRRRVVLRAPAG
jgi:CSLREA domain-containing protein